jgi:archaemetzincin
MKVKVAEQMKSLSKIQKRVNEYTEKLQYNARDILAQLRTKLPADAFCMVGVCMTDLYPKDEWNFVFGIASIRDRTGVFSFARYDPRFYTNQKY